MTNIKHKETKKWAISRKITSEALTSVPWKAYDSDFLIFFHTNLTIGLPNFLIYEDSNLKEGVIQSIFNSRGAGLRKEREKLI